MSMRPSVFLLGLVMAASLAACGNHDPEQSARDAGLIPQEAEPLIAAAKQEAITNPYLRAVKESLANARNVKFPDPPTMPDYSRFFDTESVSAYRGWDIDRIDARSYDTLTDSLNAIMQRMGPGTAEDFDRVTKYILMSVTKDPAIAKKAVGGGQISDEEILQIVQSYLHGRTPKEVTQLAERMFNAAQNRRSSAQGGAGMPVAAPDGASGPFDYPSTLPEG